MRSPRCLLSVLSLTFVFSNIALARPDDTGGGGGANLISSSSTSVGGAFAGLNINNVVGASRFYAAGYTGTRAVVSNIEGGHVWNGHETLNHSTVRLNASGFAGTQLGEYDRHATWVGQTIAGRPVSGQYYQTGIAYGATL